MFKPTKKLLFSFLFLFAGASANWISKFILPDEGVVILDDLSFKFLPTIDVMFYIEIIMVSFVLFSLFFFLKKEGFKNFHHYFYMIGIFQFIRAFLIQLTPMMPIEENLGLLGNTINHNTGMFPSGHVAIPFFLVLFTKGKYNIMFWISILITALIAAGLLLSRSHYSIDIIGSFFIIYTIKSIYEKIFIVKNI